MKLLTDQRHGLYEQMSETRDAGPGGVVRVTRHISLLPPVEFIDVTIRLTPPREPTP